MPQWRDAYKGSTLPARVEMSLLRSALEAGRGNIVHLRRFVFLCIELGEHSLGRSACESFLVNDDCEGLVWEIIGSVESDSGDWGAELVAYEKWYERSGGSDASCAQLGRSLVKFDLERSRRLLKRAARSQAPTKELARNIMGGLYRTGLFVEACDYFKLVSSFFPFDSSLKYNFLRSLYSLESGSRDNSPNLDWFDQLIQERYVEFVRSKRGVNHSLENYLVGHPDIRFEPKGITTRQGSQVSLKDQSEDCVKELLDNLKPVIDEYIRSMSSGLGGSLFSDFPLEVGMNAWGVILGKGGHQAPHIHCEGIVSGVYYVAVPPAVEESDSPSQGWLKLGSEDWNANSLEEGVFLKYVKPEEGKLVLFPSFVPHCTIPLEVEEARICVAFDVCEASSGVGKTMALSAENASAEP